MFSLSALIITGTISSIVGIVIGSLLARNFSSDSQKNRDLSSRLEETEGSLRDYQQQVTEHFAETAKLVNNLTKSYKDVHQHLAGNALKLANVDISRQLISTAVDDDKDNKEIPPSESDFQPPKDWAPKSPGSEGQLSESYGLQEDQPGTATAASEVIR